MNKFLDLIDECGRKRNFKIILDMRIQEYAGYSFPPPKLIDQGNLSSCSAAAVINACNFVLFYFGQQNRQIESSVNFLFANGRLREGTLHGDKIGSDLITILKCLKDNGLVTKSYHSDRVEDVTNFPTVDAITNGIRDGRLFVIFSLKQSELDLKECLCHHGPFVFATIVYDSFLITDHTGIVRLPIPHEKRRGRHSLCCIGYCNISGADYFIVCNSWIKTEQGIWGENGYCYIPFKYMLNPELCDKFHCIKLKRT